MYTIAPTALQYLLCTKYTGYRGKQWVRYRYVANETPGTKQAKLQLLEQLGWKCYSVTWAERYPLP